MEEHKQVLGDVSGTKFNKDGFEQEAWTSPESFIDIVSVRREKLWTRVPHLNQSLLQIDPLTHNRKGGTICHMNTLNIGWPSFTFTPHLHNIHKLIGEVKIPSTPLIVAEVVTGVSEVALLGIVHVDLVIEAEPATDMESSKQRMISALKPLAFRPLSLASFWSAM